MAILHHSARLRCPNGLGQTVRGCTHVHRFHYPKKHGSSLGRGSWRQPASILRLSQGATSVDVPLSGNQLELVKKALVSMITVFSEKQEYQKKVGARPKRWDSVDVRVEPEFTTGVRVDMFCNPNACSNAFEARVLVTIQDVSCDLRVVTEVGLEELKQSFSNCIAAGEE